MKNTMRLLAVVLTLVLVVSFAALSVSAAPAGQYLVADENGECTLDPSLGSAFITVDPEAAIYVNVANGTGAAVSAWGYYGDEMLNAEYILMITRFNQVTADEDGNASGVLEMDGFSIYNPLTETIYLYVNVDASGATGPVAGTMDNPAELVSGENIADIEANGWGYYFTYTATNDGTLVIYLPSGDWFYVVNNITAGTYGDNQWSDSDPVVDTALIPVSAGDEIQVIVNTYDPTSWNTPAGQIALWVEFACGHSNVNHVNAVEANCYENGNVEYWYCECGACWLDADQTQITNFLSTIIPAGHDPEHVAESCYNTEYWVCYTCETFWADEALTQITNSKNVIKAVPSHDLEHVAESCYNTEYWYCSECEIYWADEALTQITNSKNVIKAEATHNLEHVAANGATCYENGNVEYWYCSECETVWADEALTQITNLKSVIVPAAHNAEHVAESCYNTEHWVCYACETFWADEALTQITNSKNVIKAVPSHNLEHVAESCYNTEHWFCSECEIYWADEALTQITNSKNVIKAEATHNLQHVEAKDPDCHNNGNIEYWYCSDCEIYWADEALTQITNSKNVIIGAEFHLEHVEGKDATETESGVLEHWHCGNCGNYYTDANGENITDAESVVIPPVSDPGSNPGTNPGTGDNISLMVAMAVLSMFSGAALISKKK